MNLKLQALGPIAPGGTVLQVVGQEEALWLASPAGVFHLGGAQWRAVMRGIPFWRINAMVAAGKSLWVAGMPHGIVRSSNRGQAWHRCWTEQTEAPVVAFAASPNYTQDRVLLAGTDGDGILRSTDGGRHWELSNFGLRDFSVFAVATAPAWNKYEHAFAITEGNIYQSPNGGRAWRRAELDDTSVQPLGIAVSPNFMTDQTVFVGCGTGELLISTDAGRTYRLAAAGFEAIETLLFTPQGSLLIGTPQGICRLEAKDIIEGVLTRYSTSSLPAPVISLNTAGNTLYAGLAEGLYCSSDDGQSWQPVSGLSARRFVWGLTPGPDLWLAGGPEVGVWASQNGGQSWRSLEVDTPVLGLAATASQLWVSSPAGVATSTDGGTSWQHVFTSDILITALAVEGKAVWAGSHDSRLWRCVSGGAWQTVDTPFAGGQLLGLFAQRGVLVAAVWGAETITLWQSGDEGLNWARWFRAPSRPVTPQVIFADNGDHPALVGLGTDIHQLSTGGTWQRRKLTSQEALITALLPLSNQTLVALTDQLIASTPDNQWLRVEAEVNGHPVAALEQSGDQLVVITSDGQVWTGQVMTS